MDWYCVIGGVRYGPMAWEELLRLAREGRLSPTDLVWNSTLGSQWVQAGNVAGLSEAGPPVVVQVRPQGTGGMTPNAELMRRARGSLTGRWGLAVGANFVFNLISGAAGSVPYVGGIAQLIIGGPMELGRTSLFLRISRKADARFGQLFDGFQNFGTALGAYLLMGIFIFLWMLLLIIPGIIAALSYSMTFFIMADDPRVGPLEAIRCSKHMMRGKKWKLFCLHWRFFGWFLLCLLSFGIGLLWLEPYVRVAMAQFYDDLAS
jgi:uncharacterized membrane protein